MDPTQLILMCIQLNSIKGEFGSTQPKVSSTWFDPSWANQLSLMWTQLN